MKVKQLKQILENYSDDRIVCIHEWISKNDESLFFELMISCNPECNTTNILAFIGNGKVEPIRKGVSR